MKLWLLQRWRWPFRRNFHESILVNDKFVKYLTIDAGYVFRPVLYPPLSPGDWNTGRISRNVADHRFIISHFWHPLQFDHLELSALDGNYGQMFMKPPLRVLTLIVKIAYLPFETFYLNSEISAYEWIQNYQFGPQFLAHLTEEGRIIGFVIERIIHFWHRDAGRFGSVSALKY